MDELTPRYIVRVYPTPKNDAPVPTYFYEGAQWKWTDKKCEARLFLRRRQANQVADRWRQDVINPYWRCAIDQVLCIHRVGGAVEILGAGAEPGTRTSPTP